ncbi:transposase, partial [Burkholderia diffusa]|uniref:transposase n=1 Tax=Burkholderia diffusa TaxID=488732 RepID=UPI001FC8CAB6
MSSGPGGHAAKKSKFTEEQIAYALKQAELGTPVAEASRSMGISDATFYYIWTAPNSKRKLTDTEVDCVHISGVRAEPSA